MLSLIAASLMLGLMPPSTTSPGLVVHEWGTFTTFAGSDGTPREFQTAVGAKLPGFVFSRALQAGNEDDHLLGSLKFTRDSLVRMETPVLYFYPQRPMTVDVDVRMPEGSLTEFYPPVSVMEPEYAGLRSETCAGGRLIWRNVALIPGDAGAALPVPAITDGNHYAAAREVDAATIRFDHRAQTHHERFLFYRGIGNFDVPLRAAAQSGGRVTITNLAPEPIPALFLMEMREGKLRFVAHGAVAKSADLTLPSEPSSLDTLATAVEHALVSSGLYPREAAAMVKTWRDSWFTEEGARVLYIVPREVTDRVVPLAINPPPADTVRVFVGRAEIFTPEHQRELESALAKLASFQHAWSDPAITRLGRFSKPAVECVAAFGANDAARRAASTMLGK